MYTCILYFIFCGCNNYVIKKTDNEENLGPRNKCNNRTVLKKYSVGPSSTQSNYIYISGHQKIRNLLNKKKIKFKFNCATEAYAQ